jgi:hypothetical protein
LAPIAAAFSGWSFGRDWSWHVAGVVLGLAGAYALTRVMSSLLFNVSATDALTFASVPVILIATALAGQLFTGVARHPRGSHRRPARRMNPAARMRVDLQRSDTGRRIQVSLDVPNSCHDTAVLVRPHRARSGCRR